MINRRKFGGQALFAVGLISPVERKVTQENSGKHVVLVELFTSQG